MPLQCMYNAHCSPPFRSAAKMYWMYSVTLALVLPLSEGLRCFQTDYTSQGVQWENERMCSRYEKKTLKHKQSSYLFVTKL
jgi:hypothetical protein